MISESKTKSANYLRIVSILKALLADGTISQSEYIRAKQYYQKLTGADIVIVD
jgi:hypothetical protein